MLGDFPWDPRHVRGPPSENVVISLEEVDKGAFLFDGERRPNPNALGSVGVVDWDILHVFDGFEGTETGLGSV